MLIVFYSETGYIKNNEWKGNCTNPEKLFEDIVPSEKELISEIVPYFYFSAKSKSQITKDPQPITINKIDRRYFGRCWSFKLKYSMIATVKLRFNKGVKLYFHSYGTMKSKHPRVYLRVGPVERMTLALDYTVHSFLSTKEEPCEENILYDKDDCVDGLVHKVNILNF